MGSSSFFFFLCRLVLPVQGTHFERREEARRVRLSFPRPLPPPPPKKKDENKFKNTEGSL